MAAKKPKKADASKTARNAQPAEGASVPTGAIGVSTSSTVDAVKNEKEAHATAKPPQPPLLERFIDVVVATAEAKGWGAEVTNRDERSQQYASVAVWRDSVGGTIELSI